MAYRVEPNDEVAAQVALFNAPERYYWNRALSVIAATPFCHSGGIIERVVATAPYPLVRRPYVITCHEYISQDMVYYFDAQFLPGRTILYLIDEDDGEVEIFSLRTY